MLVGFEIICVSPTSAAIEAWSTNGSVGAIAGSGNTLYLGGTFTIVGPSSGSGTIVSSATGAPIEPSPRVAGTAYAAIPDGSGGWYIGGSIAGIAGRPCGNIAHVFGDGVVSEWNPTLDGPVFALARCGSVLYVGGNFHSVDGEQRGMAAAFDTRTGQLTAWNPQANGFVRALVAYRGSVFAGGHFTQVGGIQRGYLAKLSGDLGQPEAWTSDANSDAASFAVSNDTLYIGGYFSTVRGVARELVAAVNAETGELLGLDPQGVVEPQSGYDTEPSRVDALAIVGETLYLGGHFVGMGGQSRIGLAAVDRISGAATGWHPVLGPVYDGWPTPSVWTIQASGSSLFVGGGFNSIDSLGRGYAARFDLPSGTLSPWDPRANDVVYSIAAGPAEIFLAGGFTTQWSWENRNGLAAIDALTGKLLPWNPARETAIITSIAAGGGKVFVSGQFSSMGGQPRSSMAAVDSVTGLATSWDPHSNDVAVSMVLLDGQLYAGGFFTTIGGAVRPYAAKLDTVVGIASAWNPGCDDWVESIAAGDSAVYLAGWFAHAGGQPRNRLAAVDTLNGLATSWAPEPDGPLAALALGDSVVVVGGAFSNVGGESHSGLAAVSRLTGKAEGWNIDVAGGGVITLAISDGIIYAGGDFSFVGGEERHREVAVDGATGGILPWRSDLDGVAWSSMAQEHGVWVGGAFKVAGAVPAGGIADLDGATLTPLAARPSLVLRQSTPNPATDSADISYVLQVSAATSLVVYDLAGRRISTIVSHQLQSAGPHRVSLRTSGWKPGCYFYRLEAGGASATRKMVVVR